MRETRIGLVIIIKKNACMCERLESCKFTRIPEYSPALQGTWGFSLFTVPLVPM